MPTVWRLTPDKYVGTAFTGEGAKKYGGRFNRPETAVVYTASSLALAVLEVMANVDDYNMLLIAQLTAIPARVPPDLILPAEIEEGGTWRAGDYETTVENWRSEPPPTALQQLGTTWARRRMSTALQVPSAVIPHEHNYLLNPHHPDFDQVTIGTPMDPLIDARLAHG